MPVTTVTSDPEALTLTVVGDYGVPVRRLWEAWADPRQIERFWGPPTWPATFTRHDMTVGGRSEYFMTGPDGERSAGFWEFEEVDEGRSFTIRDGFARADGTDDTDMPVTRMVARFEAVGNGSRFILVSTFPDLATMEQLVSMGMTEGLTAALGQMDQVLADLAAFAADRAAAAELLDDTRVRVCRGAASRVSRCSDEASWSGTE